MKTNNYDTWTKQSSKILKKTTTNHDSKPQPKIGRCGTTTTVMIRAKRSQCDVHISLICIEIGISTDVLTWAKGHCSYIKASACYFL